MAVRSLVHEAVQLPSGRFKAELSLLPPPDRQRKKNKMAVLVHPWSWLGGNMDDPHCIVLNACGPGSVIQSFRDVLHLHDFYIVTYNSRGTGKSSGWPSFKGLQEVLDLKDVVHWGISYIKDVEEVLLLGYSYGALIVSMHPILASPMKTRHILLSYPLDKRGLLTFFASKTYSNGLSDLVRNSDAKVLVLFGDRDDFTASDNYEAWMAQLRELTNDARLQMTCIKGATHFWAPGVMEQMHAVVSKWLESRTEQTA